MAEPKKAYYKYCIVPMCGNNIKTAPDKIYFHVPRNENLRKKWCKAMRRDNVSTLSCLYCCADHFDIEKDTNNYIKYKIMALEHGQKVTLLLKKGVVPHIFQCQKKDKLQLPPPERKGALKRIRLALIEEALAEAALSEAGSSMTSISQIDLAEAGPSTASIPNCMDIGSPEIKIDTDTDVNVKIESIELLDESANIGDPQITVKIEPVESVEVSEEAMNIIIKEEMDISPTELHKPDVPIDQSQLENILDDLQEDNLFIEAKQKRKTKKKFTRETANNPEYKKNVSEKLREALSCSLCLKTFNYANNYSRHMKEFHNGDSVSSLTCDLCNKSFKRQYSLLRHQRSGVRCIKPHAEHSHRCICGRSYKHRSNLLRHATGYCDRREVCRGEYICDLCGKVFPNRVRLSVHLSHHKRTKKL